MSETVELVCSNRPRAATRTSGMGNQWWAREVYHIAAADGQTLCGRNSSEWLTIGPALIATVSNDRNCCKLCLKRTAP